MSSSSPSNNLFLCNRGGSSASSAYNKVGNADVSVVAATKKVNAFMNANMQSNDHSNAPSTQATNSFYFASSACPIPAATATAATATAATATADDFPQLQQRASKPAIVAAAAAAPRAGLNYKASLLTAIDGRMQEEQDRMRRAQRKDVEDKRELYEKMKYDDDRAASARAAFEPDYAANSAFDAIADDEEDLHMKQRRAA